MSDLNISVKRVYEEPAKSDGYRVLVDRLWPRGIKKEDARLDAWLKEVAPSNELRKWYGHREDRWEEFSKRYREELSHKDKQEALDDLASRARTGSVTLLCGAKDPDHSNAEVLRQFFYNYTKKILR